MENALLKETIGDKWEYVWNGLFFYGMMKWKFK